MSKHQEFPKVEQAVRQLGYWVWRVQEYLDFFHWVWGWNQQHRNNRIHVVGIDPQLPGAALSKLRLAGSTVPSTLRTDSSGRIRSSPQVMKDWIRTTSPRPYLPITRTDRTNLEILRRSVEYLLSVNALKDAKAKMEIRDKSMADNVLSLIEAEGVRVTLLAHNGHVSRAQHAGLPPSTGHHLSKKLAEDYHSIGQFFGKGAFLAHGLVSARLGLSPRPRLIKLSSNLDLVEHYFDRACATPSSIDLAAIPREEPTSWAYTEKVHRALGARVPPVLYRIAGMPIVVTESFDECIYHPEITPVTLLDKAKTCR